VAQGGCAANAHGANPDLKNDRMGRTVGVVLLFGWLAYSEPAQTGVRGSACVSP
jgi:hypothetical protein